MKPAVLVTKRIYPEAIDFLRQHAEVDYADTDDGLSAAELMERLAGKQAVVSQLTDKFPAEVIDPLGGIRVIANVAVGFDNIDVPAATAQGHPGDQHAGCSDRYHRRLRVGASAGGGAARRRRTRFVHSGQWTQMAHRPAGGARCASPDAGYLRHGPHRAGGGAAGAGVLDAILYHDARRAPDAIERELSLEFVPAEQLLREADFVSLHVPLTPETRQTDRGGTTSHDEDLRHSGEHVARAGSG